ncbi:MAG: hypothetical protein J0L53_07245 [Spirochaetes bacterium]|nr:hypothetical protein [Spirochaetota bacterium]
MLGAYQGEVERIMRGLEDRLAKGDTDSALDWLDSEMRDKLPAEVSAAVRDHIRNAWTDAAMSGVKPAQKTGTEKLPSAIKWFDAAQNYDYGALYGDYAEEIRQSVLKELEGEGDPYRSITVRARRAAGKAGEKLSKPEVENRYRMVVSNAVNKARNFSQVLSMQELGFQELEIVAILDQKTSSICRSMNGRRVRVQTMADFVNDVLDTEPAAIAKSFPWPKTTPQGKTTQVMDALACKMPPYHGRCRTTVVVGREERIVTRNGDELTQPKMPEAASLADPADARTKRQEALLRWQDYHDLTASEFASKVNALQGATWGHPEALDEHFKKHVKEFSGDGAPKNVKEYVALAKNVLTGYDRMFVYYNGGRPRTMFYRTKENQAVVVDDSSSTIATFFRPKKNMFAQYEDTYVEVIP